MLSPVKISEIFDIKKGTLQSSKNTPGKYDFVTASAEWKTNDTYSHDCEALIFAMGASGSLGRTHYVNGKFITSDLCFIITPKPHFKKKIDLRFYYYYFNSIRPKIVKETATGTSKLAINQTNFLKYEIMFGNIDEQIILRSIYEKVDIEAKELLKKLNKQEKYVARLRQSILQMAIEGKLTSQNEDDEPALILLNKIRQEIGLLIKEGKIKKEKALPNIPDKPFELPNGWEWCRLGSIISHCDYGTSEKAVENPLKNYIPVLRMNNILASGKILYDNIKYVSNIIFDLPRLYLKKSDLLFNRTNSFELVGKTGLFFNEDDKFTFASYLIRIRTMGINPRYLHICMNSLWFRLSQIKPYITQQNGQANYNGTKLKTTILPLPPLAEQNRIVEKVDRLMAICDELEKSIAISKKNSELLMQAVLNQAFTDKPQEDNIVQFVSPVQNDYIEEWDVAARENGDIKSETADKIAAILAKVGKVSK